MTVLNIARTTFSRVPRVFAVGGVFGCDLHTKQLLRPSINPVFSKSHKTMSYSIIERGKLNTLSYLLYFGINLVNYTIPLIFE